jgi:hypothetical protein
MPHTVVVDDASVAAEVFTEFLLAMSACPVTVAVVVTTLHMRKDMASIALELYLLVVCL